MSQANIEHLPPYDNDISQRIKDVQTGASPNHDILSVLKKNQQEDFSDEIRSTMQKTLTLQKTFQKIYMDIQLANTRNGQISRAFHECQQAYNNLLWDGRDAATKAAGTACLDGFVNLKVPYIILNPEVPDPDVILEIEQSLKDMPNIDVVGRKSGGFKALIEALENVEIQITEMTTSGKEPNPEVIHKSQEVHDIEKNLKLAKAKVKSLIPASLKAVGLDEDSPSVILFTAMAIRNLIRMLIADTSPNHTGIKALHEAQQEVELLEIRAAQAKNDLEARIQAENIRAEKEITKWLSISAEFGSLVASLMELEDCFSVLARITEAVGFEYSTYVAFLKGPESQNQAKRAQAQERIKAASAIYKSLEDTLLHFASTVAAPTS